MRRTIPQLLVVVCSAVFAVAVAAPASATDPIVGCHTVGTTAPDGTPRYVTVCVPPVSH